jgi:multisubunit Na+/H+ antiporter MnhB subunit
MPLADFGSPIGLLAGLATTASAVIGLYIGYQAYRGLRRNDDRSMRWLSVGMILLFGLTYTLAVVGQGLFTFRLVSIHHQNVVRLFVRLTQLVGLACIAYSLQIARTR